MKKLFWILLGSLFLLSTACSDEDDNSGKQDIDVAKELLKTELVRLKVGLGMGMAVDTRLIYDDKDEENIKLLWNEDDKIRIYWKDTDNKYHSSLFTLKGGVGTAEGTFEGMAPKSLSENANYEILYPGEKFQEIYLETDDFYKRMYFPISGQKQIGNDNTKHLQDFHYMQSTENSLNGFFFRHGLMTLLKLELTLPTSYDISVHGALSAVSLVADNDVFIPQCGNNNRTNRVELSLENVVLDSKRKLVAYVMSFPAVLPMDEKFSITVQTDKGISFSAVYENKSGRDIAYESGKCYIFQRTLDSQANVYGNTIKLAAPGLLSKNPELIAQAVGTGYPNKKKLTIVGSVNTADLLAIREYLRQNEFVELDLDFTDTDLINIPDECFRHCGISSIVAPNVKSIGNYAFAECYRLSSVSIPAAISIGNYAFSGCDRTSGSNVVGWSKLSTVDFPAVKSIGDYAFEDCDKLSSINFPVVTTIGKGAFDSCRGLSVLNFPEVLSIGEIAFRWAKGVSSVEFPNLRTIGKEAFEGCSNLVSVDSPSVTLISEGGFRNCTKLESISFPNVVTLGVIKENVSGSAFGVFSGCLNLSSVNLPVVKSLGNGTFVDCSLTSITLPMVEAVGTDAFEGCSGLSSVDLPQVNRIYTSAFSGCSNLSLLDFPMLTVLDPVVFFGCSNLNHINLPKATNIGWGIFRDCPNITSVVLSSSKPISFDYQDYSTDNIDLTLHINKKNDVVGLKWKNMTWKAISFVDDNGNPVTE